jgi:DNA-binding NtrC family response regulator
VGKSIRELANVLERAKILADGPVTSSHVLPENITRPQIASPKTDGEAIEPLETITREHVVNALECGGEQISGCGDAGINAPAFVPGA